MLDVNIIVIRGNLRS